MAKISKKEIAKEKVKKLNFEVKKAMNTAIIAAFGFLIALAWKDAITEYVGILMAKSPIQGSLVSAIIITIISVIGILIVTRLIKVEE